MNNNNLDASTLEPIETEELIKRSDVLGTPLTIVTTNGESFVTLGIYRVSENMTYEEAVKAVEEKDWNILLNCLTAILDAQEKMKANKQNLINNE